MPAILPILFVLGVVAPIWIIAARRARSDRSLPAEPSRDQDDDWAGRQW